MGEIVDLADKVKRYFKFTPLELRSLIIATLVIAFIISFKEWGYGSDFNIGVGLFNWLPLFITDGGRMAYVLTHKIFNDKKKALRAWSSINFLCLFIILLQLGAFFVQLF